MHRVVVFITTCSYLCHYYSVASLEVPDFVDTMENITASVGRHALFTCTVRHVDNSKVAFVRVDTQTILTIDDTVITRNPRIEIRHFLDNADSTGTPGTKKKPRVMWQLSVNDVQVTDAGGYMCQLNTEPMTSQSAYLSVTVPPDILVNESSTDVTVLEGSTVSLRCAATGQPKPSIVWKREDNKLIADDGYVREGSFLELVNVSRQQMAAYLCIASNGILPSVSKRILVQIQHLPVVSIRVDSVETDTIQRWMNESVTLECLCESYPWPVTFWVLNGEYLFPNNKTHVITTTTLQNYVTRSQIVIPQLSRENQGDYSCFCRNSLGIRKATTRVTGLYPIQHNKRRVISDRDKTADDPVNEPLETSTLTEPLEDKPGQTQVNSAHISNTSRHQSVGHNPLESTLMPLIRVNYQSSSSTASASSLWSSTSLLLFYLTTRYFT